MGALSKAWKLHRLGYSEMAFQLIEKISAEEVDENALESLIELKTQVLISLGRLKYALE